MIRIFFHLTALFRLYHYYCLFFDECSLGLKLGAANQMENISLRMQTPTICLYFIVVH